MSAVSVDGLSIAYDDEGSAGAPVVVLVHGHPFDRSMWRPQVERLVEAGRRVIVPDLRGYGESAVVPGKTPLAAFAHDIIELLDQLGVERFALGGLSMGGQIVMELHRQVADRIRGLLLADTAPWPETPDGRRTRNEVADRLLREGMRPYAEEVLPKMVAPATIERLPAVAEHVLGMMLGTSPEGAAAALRGRAERPDYAESLSRAKVPALIVVGSEDEYTPVDDARQMHELIPDSTLVVVDGAGHMPNLECPEAFDQALLAFLDAL
ncbi:alpha/beta fold hydrolase [Actinoallomurus bryophytorum]|uniref:Pimeloyl-ACP methyl ester carboxylesterase n=1 Tax=Actinoallomurus bryophytorum TaxID=1490222 RepID=A0A543CTW0_9ACTN|nr:alpha/beta hydrolase [Actinoallomurus bryophytorum]TQM00535.1 pimeloyl-ACP methyl ester carboxylesterase [Actinoallomurus bryophytorum]